MRLSIIINICFIFSIPLLAQIQYSDVALQIGIDHQYLQGGPGGGVSFVDFDGEKFLNYSYLKDELSEEDLNIYAPKIIKGINKIIDWANK